MIERLDYVSIIGPAIASMAKAKDDLKAIGAKMRAMIELRVSQINGCAYCVDLHTMEARKAGETTQRLDCLTVWREVSFFDDAEKAAFDFPSIGFKPPASSRSASAPLVMIFSPGF